MKCGSRLILPLAGLTACLAGCVSAPTNSTTPWVPPKDAQKADAVWKEVRADQTDFAKPLALADLVDIALQNNPATRKTWYDANAAVAQVEQARGYFMPTLTGTLGANTQRTLAEPDGFDTDFAKYGPGLQMNYLLFNFGGGRNAAVDQALQTVYAANYTFNQSIQDVLLAVESAYYGLISARAGVEAADASVKDAKTALDATQDRKAAGLGTELDVLQAQAAYDKALYNRASAQGALKMAHGALAQSLGVSADTAIQVQEPTLDVPGAVSAQDLRTLIDAALARRPDIAALRATLAAKQAAVTVAGSGLWPSLYLTGNGSRDYYETYTGKDMQDRDWSYGGGVSLQWTLFDGLQTVGAKRAARAQAASVQAQLKQAELKASADVWTGYSNYDTALQKYQFSEAYLKSTTASYALALDSYKAGLKSILDLLNAESGLEQARSQHVAARQDVFTALAKLAYATGLLDKGGAAQTRNLFSNSK